MSHGVGHRCGSDPMLLWLWCRWAATAPIQPLAWELPYAASVALKRQKKVYVLFMYLCVYIYIYIYILCIYVYILYIYIMYLCIAIIVIIS